MPVPPQASIVDTHTSVRGASEEGVLTRSGRVSHHHQALVWPRSGSGWSAEDLCLLSSQTSSPGCPPLKAWLILSHTMGRAPGGSCRVEWLSGPGSQPAFFELCLQAILASVPQSQRTSPGPAGGNTIGGRELAGVPFRMESMMDLLTLVLMGGRETAHCRIANYVIIF
ncbi:hypothetical protein HJG60_011216 [Phyllostomus discolor]|uniref:Uncharacterized protein n=1 Tax=Phyllostomus discolor TaxID=89673 RepID=A0A834E573_9CHIR|nr:hypothetical protein HJG60_011216 [Phyllostomus discolor]